jgi:hypothetical protein
MERETWFRWRYIGMAVVLRGFLLHVCSVSHVNKGLIATYTIIFSKAITTTRLSYSMKAVFNEWRYSVYFISLRGSILYEFAVVEFSSVTTLPSRMEEVDTMIPPTPLLLRVHPFPRAIERETLYCLLMIRFDYQFFFAGCC